MMTHFSGDYSPDWQQIADRTKAEAGWRCVRCGHANERESGHVLTVHHLDGDKSNNKFWNIPALCQRCHLRIQGRVHMYRQWFLPHSEWFVPYVAGYYANQYGLPDDRQTVSEYQKELLDLGQGRITIYKFFYLAALRRNNLHKDDPLSHPKLQRSVYREYIGLMGEYAFSQFAKQPMNLHNLHEGDNGIDFTCASGSIDVKTYRHANNLLRPVCMPHPADIHILAWYNQIKAEAELLGWAWDSDMCQQPSRDFGFGIVNHFMHKKKLNPMIALKEIM